MTARFGIFADDKTAAGWQSVIARAHSNGNRLKSTLTNAFAGVVGVSTFTTQIAKAIEFGDEIGKMAVKIGATASATSELVAVARRFDIEATSLATSFRKMQVSISQAATGNKALRTTFEALGLSVETISRLQPDQQFEAIGDAISRLKDPADRARAATELFGRAGADLLPLFEQGAAGIRKAREEVREFGHVLNDIEVKKLQEADDAIKKLTATWDSFWRSAAVGAVTYAEAIATATGRLEEFAVSQNKFASAARGTLAALPIIGQLALAAEAQAQGTGPLGRDRGGLTHGRPRVGTAPGFAAPSDEHLRKLNRYSQLWIEFTENVEYFESVEKTRFEAEVNRINRRNELIEDLDRSIRGSTASSREAQQEIEGVANRMEAAFEKAAASAVFVEELQKSMFSNVSGLIASAGDGWDDFADSAINSFKRILADQATLQLFNFLAGMNDKGGGIFSFLGGLFGVGSGTSGVGTGNFSGPRASGGPVSAGRLYSVNEREMEFFRPNVGGEVIPLSKMRADGGTRSSITVVQHNHFNNMRDVTDAKMASYGKQISDVTIGRIRELQRKGEF